MFQEGLPSTSIPSFEVKGTETGFLIWLVLPHSTTSWTAQEESCHQSEGMSGTRVWLCPAPLQSSSSAGF